MLKILQIGFSIITVSLSAYGLITKDYQLNYLMVLFLGLFMLTLGIKEFQSERKFYGWLLVGVFLFSVFVSIQSFVLL
ncbi:DUF3953 domain-containing protein [Lysinibacillus xylanilyticus]|uniref:DUF3953 domain-containing protein n=1 Tax=Lysinibacillus xylanilyticus TaxID=582475 RepID=UPI002B24CFF2|nr:DUF3953 domain-containing protein [Lysinibacillus xylanilyticus]MEB2301528.1 DUF3953 domain-containing protein [Lysinibacillus xylanilyticus]